MAVFNVRMPARDLSDYLAHRLAFDSLCSLLDFFGGVILLVFGFALITAGWLQVTGSSQPQPTASEAKAGEQS